MVAAGEPTRVTRNGRRYFSKATGEEVMCNNRIAD